MKIEVVTHWFNEDKLAPLFFEHYDFADLIHVFLDGESSEESKETLYNYELRNSKIIVHPFESTNGMDDTQKVMRINALVNSMTCDWAINVDFDEFVFALPPRETIRGFLSRTNAHIVLAQLWQVYRHETDKDLDYNNLDINDRIHGDPNFVIGNNRIYVKPIIVNPKAHIVWKPGNHAVMNPHAYVYCRDRLYGAHWAMADPELAIERRYFGRTIRQSKHNIFRNLSHHLHHLTPNSIRNECEQHLKDPKLFDFSYTESKINDKISIVIPYIREAGFNRCVEAISKNAIDGQYEIIADEDKDRIGVAKKVKELVDKAKYDLIMFLGDDTIPKENFMLNAMKMRERLPEKWGLVGLNDSFSSGFLNATHWLADRKLLELLDGEFFHTGYRHCYADNELTTRCIAMGKYIFASNAEIDHINPITKNDKSLYDADYRWVYRAENIKHDRELFLRRQANNWKERD